MYIEEAERLELRTFLPPNVPKDPGTPKMIAYDEWIQIGDLRRRFSFGTRVDHSRVFV